MQNRRNLTLAIVALAVPLSLSLATGPKLQAPASPVPALPQWQIDAGGSAKFDVASVKQNKSGSQFSDVNIPIGPGDAYNPTGGLYSGTNVPLVSYMYFAYQLTGNQLMTLLPRLPKWVTADRFDIQARASGNPTKDQMRLMLQSLLADRFKLTVHYETQQLPAFALIAIKPGKTGPGLQPHADNAACFTAPPPPSVTGSVPPPPPTVAGGFPAYCGSVVGMPASTPGSTRVGARNVSIGVLVTFLSQVGGLGRPVIDQTGLNGSIDFTFEWTPQPNGPDPNPQADVVGPTFLEAVKEQLGLKLVPETGPLDVLVVDHVEEPSPN